MHKQFFGLLGIISFSAVGDIIYNFNEPVQDLSNWSFVSPNYEVDDNTFDGWEIYTPERGFTPKGGVQHDASSGCMTPNETMGKHTDFLKLGISGGLQAYNGGNLCISFSDAKPLSSPSTDWPLVGWMLFTANVNGSAYTLGYEMPFAIGQGPQEIEFSLSAENFYLINDITYTMPGFVIEPPSLTVNTGAKGDLGGLDFDAFLANCDGIYIRSIWQSDGFVGGEPKYDGTKLFSFSIKAGQVIPEPGGITLSLCLLSLSLLKRQRKTSRRG